MEFLEKLSGYIFVGAIIAAAFLPDIIAGVTKAMRMGRENYPKEARKKKWMWIGIFLGIAAISGLIYLLCSGYFSK